MAAQRKPFNLGNDCEVVASGPFGLIEFPKVTGFKIKQRIKKASIEPLNSAPLELHVPMGWEGSFEIERASPAADLLANAIEAGFLANGDLGAGTLTQYVNEIDGSQSIFQMGEVAMSLSDAGDWSRGKSVKQTVEFFASTRVTIG
jgi:hypothetical protein